MTDVSRRAFNQQTVGSLLTLSLLETLYATDAFAAEIKPVTARWLAELDELGHDLKGKKTRRGPMAGKSRGLVLKSRTCGITEIHRIRQTHQGPQLS